MVHTIFVYTEIVKNVTLSADENLIEQARETARAQHKTLNQAFREWLTEYTRREADARAIDALYERIAYVDSGGRKFTREEMNER